MECCRHKMLCRLRPTVVVPVVRWVLLSALLAPVAAAEETSVLAPSATSLDTVVPNSAWESFTLPDAPQPKTPARVTPARVASRPQLDWRPALAADAAKKVPTSGPTASGPQLGSANTSVEPKTFHFDTKQAAPITPIEPVGVTPAPTIKPQAKKPAARQQAKSVAPSAAKSSAAKPPAAKPLAVKPRGPQSSKSTASSKKTVTQEPPTPLTRSQRYLRSRMRTVLSFYYRKPLNTQQNNPWEIMHGMLSYELHSRVRDGGPKGRPMTAVGHLCFNRPSKRQQLMRMTPEGFIDAPIGVGLQGHLGQLMAMLAQCNVSPDYPIRIDDEKLTIHDLIRSEQRTCYTKSELTFKLMGLGHYLASDAEWTNDRGEAWDIPRLIKEERTQRIRGAACGGTHRLSGLSLAYRRREARGEPLDGEYLEAARFVSQYQTLAFKLQNSDGSLSTEWFRGRGAEEDIERRIRTTGHLLEWLVYSLPDEQLRSSRTVRAVNYLTNLLATNANQEWHLGSLGHAIHALVLYDKRVFQPHDEAKNQGIAIDPTASQYRGYAIYRGVMRNSAPQSSGFFGLFGPSNAQRSTGHHRR